MDYSVYKVQKALQWLLGCTKIWPFHQKITEPSQKLVLTIRRKHANF